MFRVAILGGNIGGSALISLLRGDPTTELVGVYEKRPDAPGVILARKWNIPVIEDIMSLRTVNPEIVINVTGDPKLSNEIRIAFENKVEVIEGMGARFLWEIIEKQKRARIEVFKIAEDQKTIFTAASKLYAADFDDFLRFVLDKAVELSESPAGSIAVYENGEMRLVASKGLSKKFIENKAWGVMSGGLTEMILQNKNIVSITDTLKEEHTRNNPALMSEKIRAMLACPVIFRGEVAGILYIDDFRPRQFSERQKSSLNLLAGLIGVAIDRFALIRRIEELRFKCAHLIEATNDMVLITDSAGLVSVFNERATEILGYTRQDLTGMAIGSLIKDDSWELIQKELDKKSVLTGYEVVVIGFGFREFDARLNAIVLRDQDGNPSGSIFVLKNLTEERDLMKALEDKTKALKELNENLEKKVMERTEEFEKINRELERANQLKGRFISNMSHELRTPLNSIIGFSDVLLERTFGDLSENQERYVKNIFSAGKHLLELINNVLDIAKIEAGKYEMVYETFPIGTIADEVINIMKPLAENKFIEIVVSIGEGISDVTADKVKLKQILYNLLSNAIKFTPEGGKIGNDSNGRKY